MMNSSKPGDNISAVEVTDISAHGIWLLVDDEEHFLPHKEFPWFKQGTVQDVLNVVEEAPGSFHWPALDVDLSIDMIRHPGRFPLKSR